MTRFTHVIKRSGAIVPFNQERISNAIYRAAVAVGGRDRERAVWLSGQVVQLLEQVVLPGSAPHIEEIQDAVEKDKDDYVLFQEIRSGLILSISMASILVAFAENHLSSATAFCMVLLGINLSNLRLARNLK